MQKEGLKDSLDPQLQDHKKMNNQTLEEKIERLPLDAIDLFSDLFSDEAFFKESVLFGIEDFVLENKTKFIEKLIDIEIENKDRNYFSEYLQTITTDNLIIKTIIENLEISIWPEIDEIYKNEKVKISIQSSLTDPLEEAKLNEKIDSSHISHVDILSEIENPTPSISTTSNFQKQINQTDILTTDSPTAGISNSSPKTNIYQINTSTDTPSLHSSDPSVVPYTNPALHIASKLDQNLSTPSASASKDIYVSKKPDPYHEPVEF